MKREEIAPDPTLADPAAFAEGLQRKLIENSRDRRRLTERLQTMLADDSERQLLMAAASEVASASRELVPAQSEMVIEREREQRQLELVYRKLLHPPEQREIRQVGTHVCDRNCEFRQAADECGLNGCRAVAIEASQTMPDSTMPDELWVCVKSGAMHRCTETTCDALEPDSQGCRVQCFKTGKVYGAIARPDPRAFFSADFYPSAAAAEQVMNDYASADLTRPAEVSPWSRVKLLPEKRRKKKRKTTTDGDERPIARRQQDRVGGITSSIVDSTMRTKMNEISAANASAFIDAEIDRRAGELRLVYSQLPKMNAAMRSCYTRSLQIAAAAVVVLPVTQKTALALSEDMQVVRTYHYGMLIWRGWSLIASRPDATETHDGDVKFRHISLGVLYHAMRGFGVPFELRGTPKYAEHRDAVLAALRKISKRDDMDEETLLKTFARRWYTAFLTADPYLGERLVQENKVGTKNTTIDGIQVDSVGVTAGMGLVKTGLTAVAEWSMREFVRDVAVRGVEADVAAEKFRLRGADFLLSSHRS